MKQGMNFQDIIAALNNYWTKQGCVLVQPYDLEKGAGTYNPETFFGSLTKKPVRRAYVEPCRRPADGRYGENPNRLGKYYQYQVILKPAPENVQHIYLNSLKAIGLDPKEHDVRWIEDDWQSPTLGASGVGWEIWLDGMEITQFTYFQNMAGYSLNPITAEITYGLERIAMYCQKVDNVFDLRWNDTVTYRDVHHEGERQFSHYYFEETNVEHLRRYIKECEEECYALCKKGLYLPAYDNTMKLSQYFNMLEARGAISVQDRTNNITKIRNLAKACAKTYIESAEHSSSPAQNNTAPANANTREGHSKTAKASAQGAEHSSSPAQNNTAPTNANTREGHSKTAKASAKGAEHSSSPAQNNTAPTNANTREGHKE